MTSPSHRTWAEVSALCDADLAHARAQAEQIYDTALAHVRAEIATTGAAIVIEEVGTILPKRPSDAPLAMRMDVTATTLVFARQPHVREAPGEKHRSWRIDLDGAPHLPSEVRDGLSRAIAKVAELQAPPLI